MGHLPQCSGDPAALPQVDLVAGAVVDHIATTRPEKLGHRPVLHRMGTITCI